jgi:hypothetical protein
MIYPLLAVAIKRRMYRIDASDLVDLQRAASAGGHRITRFEALCSHVWKLLAQAVGKVSYSWPVCHPEAKNKTRTWLASIRC